MFLLSKMRSADENAFESLSQQMRGYASCISRVDTSYFRKRSSTTSKRSSTPSAAAASSSSSKSSSSWTSPSSTSVGVGWQCDQPVDSPVQAACLLLLTSGRGRSADHQSGSGSTWSDLAPRESRSKGMMDSPDTLCTQYRLCVQLMKTLIKQE